MQSGETEYVATTSSSQGALLFVSDADGQEALDFACELADESDVQLQLLHVVNPEDTPSTPDGMMGIQYRLETLAQRLRRLKRRAEATLLFGIPERVIPKRAAEIGASLVLIGLNAAKTDRARKKLMKRLVQECECPVLVLPPTGRILGSASRIIGLPPRHWLVKPNRLRYT